MTFEEGGAIRKPRKKSPKRDDKIEQALATKVGGAIRKPRKKSPKRDDKIEQALATKVGGRMRFHDAKHEYLFKKLTGKGAKHDSPMCRKMMHDIMSKYDPQILRSYLAGQGKSEPRFHNDHVDQPAPPRRADVRPHIVEMGGSLNPITHSEDGFLVSHNSEFHSYFEVV